MKLTGTMDRIEESIQRSKYITSHAKDVFYPNRPTRPLPSSVGPGKIVGEYHEPGYGTLHITLEDAPGHGGDKVKTLVGRCTGRSLVDSDADTDGGYELRFDHVSGNFWVMQLWVPSLDDQQGYFAGEVKVGVAGDVLGLEVRLSTPLDNIDEGTIYYTKV